LDAKRWLRRQWLASTAQLIWSLALARNFVDFMDRASWTLFSVQLDPLHKKEAGHPLHDFRQLCIKPRHAGANRP
jgi:hypothetical protein